MAEPSSRRRCAGVVVELAAAPDPDWDQQRVGDPLRHEPGGRRDAGHVRRARALARRSARRPAPSSCRRARSRGFARDPDGRGRPPPRSGSRRSRKDNQLASLPLRITRAVDGALDEPGNAFLFQTLALLFGFYVAGFLAMGPVGQGNYYETVAALPTALVVEAISRAYYSRAAAARTKTLRVLNSFKNGFMYGIVIDCLKVGG